MIRKAERRDIPSVAALYDAVLDAETAAGRSFSNWKKGEYPTESTASVAVEAGTLYVGEENGKLWGAVILNDCQLPEYDRVSWTIPAARVGVIHTLCIDPEETGKGYARALVAFCEERCRQAGLSVMRLDTWEGNLPAHRLYEGMGYRVCGAVETFFQGVIPETLHCLEKRL